MLITREADGRVTLRSSDEAEVITMNDFFAAIAVGVVLDYGGCHEHPHWPGSVCPVFENQGRSIKITGSSELDALVANGIRNLCYYGHDTKITITQKETDDLGRSVVTLLVAATCKGCGQPCVTLRAAEWGFCPSCVEQCDHTWVIGAVHGGTTKDGKYLDIGVGWFCSICGTGQPAEGGNPADKTLAEHYQAALAAGVVDGIIAC